VVVIILLLSWAIVTLFKINRRDWVIFLSGGIFSLALKMALERIHLI
jgi:hypothetical protein